MAKKDKKIAIIACHFYDINVWGGSYHVALLARILKLLGEVTIVTTKAKDHLTWKNEIQSKKELFFNIPVIRFANDSTITPRVITNLSHGLLKNKNHTIQEEAEWIKLNGPFSSSLLDYIKKNTNTFDLFFFIGYNNPITYFGLPLVKEKAFLIPLVHKDPKLYFQIFNNFFSKPAVILPSTEKEKTIIKKRFTNYSPLHVLGINIDEKRLKIKKNVLKNFSIKNPYIIFIGRVEPYKGIFELVDFFCRFINETRHPLDLVIIGKKTFPIKHHKNIKQLGVVSPEEKKTLIGKSLLLVNPSWYESLSLTILEAWQQKKPVLVYGYNPVIRDQVIRSGGGLYYENYPEFKERLSQLIISDKVRKNFGGNGYLFYKENYSFSVIKNKLKKIISDFYKK